jgi:hypothetical protein
MAGLRSFAHSVKGLRERDQIRYIMVHRVMYVTVWLSGFISKEKLYERV